MLTLDKDLLSCACGGVIVRVKVWNGHKQRSKNAANVECTRLNEDLMNMHQGGSCIFHDGVLADDHHRHSAGRPIYLTSQVMRKIGGCKILHAVLLLLLLLSLLHPHLH